MPQILVVEDERLVAADIQHALRASGYSVPRTVASGEEAMESVARSRPDLVLMDIHIKGEIDGIATAMRIRESAGLPVVFLTANADDDTISRARHAEPYGYVLKPFNDRELHSTIEMALFKHAMDAERRRTQEQLATANRLASLGTLTVGVAHEINNPLAYMLANLDFALDNLARLPAVLEPAVGAGVAEAKAAIALVADVVPPLLDVQKGAERVHSIVKDLQAVSQPRDHSRQKVALRQVVEVALQMAGHQIGQRAQLRTDLTSAPGAMGNLGQLVQVVVNLLVNAVQALPEDQPASNEIHVSLRLEEREGAQSAGDGAASRAVLEVSDSGCGIAPGDLHRIFDPFFTTRPVGSGTGLGLSISRGIVLAHGGEISAHRRDPRGTTLRVTLPAV